MDMLKIIQDTEDLGIYNKNIFKPLSNFHAFIEEIERPRHVYLDNIDKHLRRGIVLCHGHNHSNHTLRKIKFINYWYYIDGDPESHPDYYADVSSINDMNYFPNEYFDCVLSLYCPVGRDKILYNILSISHRILKKNGVILFTEMPRLFFHYINNNHYQYIIDIIHNTIDDATFEGLKKEYQEIYGTDVIDKNFYNELMTNNFDYPQKLAINKIINKFAKKITKQLLLENNFRYVDIKNNFLIAKKI